MLRYGLHDSVSASISDGVKMAPFILFFPPSRLLSDVTVRPAGSGGGGACMRVRTRVTDGVSGGGIDGRPSAPGAGAVVLAAEATGRTIDAAFAFPSGRPFRLGSSSAAPSSTSWSESVSILSEAETPLTLSPDSAKFDLGLDLRLGVDLSSAFRGSSEGPGSFFGDISIRNSGWCCESTQRRRPRCTPRSPARLSLLDYFEDLTAVHTNRQDVRAPKREDGEHFDCDSSAPPPSLRRDVYLPVHWRNTRPSDLVKMKKRTAYFANSIDCS